MPIAPYLAGVASLWMGVQGTVTVSASSQGTTRNTFASNELDFDVETAPSAGLSLKGGRAELTLGYTPRFTQRGIRTEKNTLVLHTAYAGFSFGGPRYSVSISQSGSIGTQSFGALIAPSIDPNARPDPTAPRISVLPPAQKVRVLSETTSAQATYNWNRRWASGMNASYAISGGSGGSAQMLLPRQKAAAAGLSCDYMFSRRDSFGSDLTGSHYAFSNGYEHLVLSLTGNWSHQFSPRVGGTLTLGLVGFRSENPGFTPYYSLSTTAAASGSVNFIRSRGLAVTMTAGVALAPAVSPLTGILQQRVQGTTSLLVAVRRLSITAAADGAQTLPLDDPRDTTIFGAGLSASYSAASWVGIAAGYRTAWQTSRDPRVPTLPRQWGLFLAVSIAAPPIRF